jgi:hypothetical protein
MQNKTLLGGIIGFIFGGLVVSLAAVTIDKPHDNGKDTGHAPSSAQTMHDKSDQLQAKSGDDFDRAFLDMMIDHHEGALDMAGLAATKAKHAEIKQLANDIKKAQDAEITTMKQWQQDWGYRTSSSPHHDPGQSQEPGDPMPREY